MESANLNTTLRLPYLGSNRDLIRSVVAMYRHDAYRVRSIRNRRTTDRITQSIDLPDGVVATVQPCDAARERGTFHPTLTAETLVSQQ